MNRLHALLLSFLFFLTAGTPSYAQQATVTTGGTLSHSTGSISYSVGLIPFNRHDTVEGSLTEGMFHIYKVKTFRGEDKIERPHVTIFPNPTPDWINIRMDDHSAGSLTVVLSDIKGQTMATIKIEDRHEGRLSLNGYQPGIYFLQIRKDSISMETFKIIKL